MVTTYSTGPYAAPLGPSPALGAGVGPVTDAYPAPGALAGIGTGVDAALGALSGLTLPGGTPDNPLAIGLTAEPTALMVPLSESRRGAIQHLEASRDVVMPVTVIAEVDMSNLKALHDWAKPVFEQQAGAPLSYLAFFARATVQALLAYPVMNSILTPGGYAVPRFVHLAVAAQGPVSVLTPVIRYAERMTIPQLAVEIHRLGQLARNAQLSTEDMAGQTFLITNPGRWGLTLVGNPAVKPPNIATMSFEAITRRVKVLDNDQVAIRPMMYIALTSDHRAVDGLDMVAFAGKVKQILENVAF